MATAAAVVGAAVGVKGSLDASKARKKAAKDAERAAISSAKQLEEAGRKGEADILRAQAEAVRLAGLGAEEAQARIQPFVEPGQEAFRQAQQQILTGQQFTGPAAEAIRQASLRGAQAPGLAQLTGPLAAESQRQAGLAVSAAQPTFRQGLLTAAQLGVAATGDVAGIRQRGLERLADIAGATGAQRASVLVGATPGLATLAGGAQEARLLGDVAGQQFKTSTAETLAGLAGRLT